jgi:hypothetical protein
MTYSELYKRAIKKLNLKQEDIEDYRPAAELYIDQITGTIPDAIIIWLKSGEQIVYIEPRAVREKKFLEILEGVKGFSNKNTLAILTEAFVQENGPFTIETGEKVRKILEEKES